MKKLAIFVEGQTERVFVERILTEVIGRKHLHLESFSASGGGASGARTLTRVQASTPASVAKYYIMVVDCGTDNRVRSDIADHYDGLVGAGFSGIIGIRDVFPDVSLSGLARLRTGLNFGLKSDPIQVLFVLGVMEIESWFISEFTHFERLNSKLTCDLIANSLGWDPRVDDIQQRANPASDLNDAYHLVSHRYNKSRRNVERTVALLDYQRLYMEMSGRFADLDAFNQCLDAFLS